MNKSVILNQNKFNFVLYLVRTLFEYHLKFYIPYFRKNSDKWEHGNENIQKTKNKALWRMISESRNVPPWGEKVKEIDSSIYKIFEHTSVKGKSGSAFPPSKL